MRSSWLLLVPPIVFVFACPAQKAAPKPFCDPGTEIFCRCRGGAPGTKLCNTDGNSFGECRLEDGECTEIPPDPQTTDVGAGAGPASVGSGGMTGAGGMSAGTCSHDLCAPGPVLDVNCDPCVTKLCKGIDPWCCDAMNKAASWDSMCVGEIAAVCGKSCSGAGGGPASSSSKASSGSGGGSGCYKVDELIPGDFVITEVMNNPASLDDKVGEWFEVKNTSDNCIDMQGIVIESNGDPSHTIASSITVQIGNYVTLGRDKAALGAIGVNLSYAYGASITLSNSADTLTLRTGSSVIDSISYTAAKINPNGASRTLDPKFTDPKANDDETHWCEAKSFIMGASGDRGTPNKANDSCP